MTVSVHWCDTIFNVDGSSSLLHTCDKNTLYKKFVNNKTRIIMYAIIILWLLHKKLQMLRFNNWHIKTAE